MVLKDKHMQVQNCSGRLYLVLRAKNLEGSNGSRWFWMVRGSSMFYITFTLKQQNVFSRLSHDRLFPPPNHCIHLLLLCYLFLEPSVAPSVKRSDPDLGGPGEFWLVLRCKSPYHGIHEVLYLNLTTNISFVHQIALSICCCSSLPLTFRKTLWGHQTTSWTRSKS